MSKAYSRVLLVTANVGSIFEEPDKMIPIWMQEFMEVITRLEPEFLAIHCQEVGGKNYEDTMQHVNKFIKLLLSSPEMQQFDRARVFLDEDFTAVEKFTALGSLYFVHHTLPPVEIFDFQDAKFVTLEGKEVLSGNIEHVRLKEKAKFAQEFFPDFVWSRKGFIRTRWNLCGTVFDLVNIHLIHDVSNVAAMDASPSPYCDFRVKALLHTINRFETDRYDKVPFFVFGDFNFRLDTNELVKRLTANSVEQRILGKKNDVSKVIFKQQDNGKVILTVGKKDFHHHEHNQLFSRHNAMTLQIYDKEPEACRSKLFEYNVTFPPSYPFSEDAEDGTSYMPTRCPGWCDRIMMSHDVVNLFHNENGFTSEYRMIGMHICMGDHKPIYLSLQLRHHATTGNNDQVCESTGPSPTDALTAMVTVARGDDDNTTVDLVGGNERKHAPVRHVISVNGEEEDVENINIHDFTTFEQEDLIGSRFIGSLKRKSTDTDEVKGPRRGLDSFRNAVRTVLSTEAVMRALRHYAHRSDSEDTEDDDDDDSATRQPAPIPGGAAVNGIQLAGTLSDELSIKPEAEKVESAVCLDETKVVGTSVRTAINSDTLQTGISSNATGIVDGRIEVAVGSSEQPLEETLIPVFTSPQPATEAKPAVDTIAVGPLTSVTTKEPLTDTIALSQPSSITTATAPMIDTIAISLPTSNNASSCSPLIQPTTQEPLNDQLIESSTVQPIKDLPNDQLTDEQLTEDQVTEGLSDDQLTKGAATDEGLSDDQLAENVTERLLTDGPSSRAKSPAAAASHRSSCSDCCCVQ